MKGYIAVLKARFFILVQYRAAALAGFGTQIFWGIVNVMILTAFYAQANTDKPISLPQAITFIWLAQACFTLLPWTIDREIGSQIVSGDVAYELVRPINLYWLWFYRSLAIRTIPFLMRAIPIFLIATLFLGLQLPISWPAALLFIFSLLLSFILASAITTIITITLFWTIYSDGILKILPNTVFLLSGSMIPLPLFPNVLKPFLYLQPFRGVVDIPIRFYTGIISINEAHYYLGFQVLWTLILVILGKWLMIRAISRHVI
ncbi:MAG: ABC-2 family transporter protein [Chlamydiae bacterium]|nr:ABC-2 family transporter protein [Chlamydiota bacterium]